MYAVIETGGKQYRVEVGTELQVELLDVAPGQAITLDRVLLVADGDEAAVGRPLVANAAVDVEVVRQTRGEKLIAFKYRPKARSRVKKGHRQELTVLRVTDVRLNGKSAAEADRKASEDARTERQRLEEAAARQAAEDAALAAKLAARSATPEATAKGTKAGKSTTAAEPEAGEAAPARKRTRATAKAERAATESTTEASTEPATDAPGAAPGPVEASGDVAETTETTEASAEAPKRTRTKKSE